MTTDYSEILLDLRAGKGVAVLTLNRPDSLNALNLTIREEIADAVERVAADDQVGALVLTGAGGRAFSVGADLKDPKTDHSVDDFEAFIDGDRIKGRWYELLTHYPKGVVAAIDGYAAGSGLQLALAADVLVGTETARFWVPQVALGLAPHVGTLLKLARIMGQQRMLEMILTNRKLEAAEALQYGLLSAVVPADELLPYAIGIGEKIATSPRLSIKLTKETYFRALDMTWDEAIAVDRWKSFGMWQTREKKKRHADMIAKLKGTT